MRKIYHLLSCSTNKKILSQLNLEGVELQNIKTEMYSEEQLDEMYSLSGSYKSLFSNRAQKYKLLGLKDMVLTESDYKKYILSDYTFLKRPVAIIDGEIFVGNSKENVQNLISKLS